MWEAILQEYKEETLQITDRVIDGDNQSWLF